MTTALHVSAIACANIHSLLNRCETFVQVGSKVAVGKLIPARNSESVDSVKDDRHWHFATKFFSQ